MTERIMKTGYEWNAEVLAPFDGIVEAIHINPNTNNLGSLIESI